MEDNINFIEVSLVKPKYWQFLVIYIFPGSNLFKESN